MLFMCSIIQVLQNIYLCGIKSKYLYKEQNMKAELQINKKHNLSSTKINVRIKYGFFVL